MASAFEAFTASDRCDTGDCGAQAYFRFTLKAGGDLMFCHHHGQKNFKALDPLSKHIYDEVYRLTKTSYLI